MNDAIGLQFPLAGDTRPTSRPAQQIVAEAVRSYEPELAAEIDAERNWRKGYVDALGRVSALAATSAETALGIATDGLRAMGDALVLAGPQGEVPLREADLNTSGVSVDSTVLTGTEAPIQELRVPWQGRELAGRELLDEVGRWVDSGLAEPSLRSAIAAVVAHPEWLSLPGYRIAVAGAGSQMGPLPALLSWGAHVLAIDLPWPRIWKRLKELPNAGTLVLPAVTGDTGLDLARHPAAAVDWLDREAGTDSLVLGDYAYADGGAHVRVTAASDAVGMTLSQRREVAWSWLATPTDAFVVPADVVAAARAEWHSRGIRAALQKPLQLASRGKLFARSYARAGEGWGVADVLVPQQGPNYAIAKRLQRWRGMAAEAAGQRVSFNVAPATWTRSVTKNRVLAAAYGGAKHFGVEIFEPETTRMLMAALLVHDLQRELPTRSHPEDLFVDQAVHGKLWRVAYEPRSALGVAALAGLPGALVNRR